MKFKMISGIKNHETDKPTLRDINISIDALDPDNDDPFLILEPEKPISNSIFIQAVSFIDDETDEPAFDIEIQTNTNNIIKQYTHTFYDKNEIKKIFENYFINNQIPDYSKWKDITDDIFGEKNTKRIDIFKLAEKTSRENKIIFNCYDYIHGDTIINNVNIYQYIAEAIVLLFEILSTDSKSEIYYSESKKIFFFNINTPNKWSFISTKIKRIQALKHKDNIELACFDVNNEYIYYKIDEIEANVIIIISFILLFSEKMIKDEIFLLETLEYSINQTKQRFDDLYIKFISEINRMSYYIKYLNSKPDEFNLTKYSPISIIFDNYKCLNS